MPETLLLFDIGNTNIKIAIADAMGSNCVRDAFALPTHGNATADSLGLQILELCRFSGVDTKRIAACVGCSVVPGINPMVQRALKRYLGKDLLFAPGDLSIPLENRYERPQEVGADRLVAAYAAMTMFPGPAHISVDFGTATTFDVVRDNAYLGGLICPGLQSSAAALASKTAKLPQVSLEIESSVINVGRSTTQSLNQGFLFGFAAMVEGLYERLREQVHPDTILVGTGGFAEPISRLCGCIRYTHPQLMLEGLRKLWMRANGR